MTDYKFIVGIDFGTVSSEVSIAHVNDPLDINTVNNWKESSKKKQRFLSSILYKNDSESKIVCGAVSTEKEPGDVYISNIKQYLSDIENGNQQLENLKDGLTVQNVVTDYLRELIKLAFKRLEVHKDFSKSQFFEDFDRQNTDNVRYCLVCSSNEKEFMKRCFIETEIIRENEVENRLSLVTEVEAIAYHYLSLDRKITRITTNQSYLVCDVGETAVEIAKIHADTTESFSTVELISENLGRGSIYLDIKFREYLEDNSSRLNLNPGLIDELVEDFKEKIKFSFYMSDNPETIALTSKDANGDIVNITYADLNDNVFSPVIDHIYELLAAVKEHEGNKVFLSGKYGLDAYFVDSILAKSDNYLPRDIDFIETKFDALSSGAVSSASRLSVSQVPSIKKTDLDQIEYSSEEDIDKSFTNDGYDFMVGIDFGTIFSGCSYVNLKDEKQTIKTIRDRWPGGNSTVYGKASTLLMLDKKMKPMYWGEEARLKVNNNKDLHLLGNFKLGLDSKQSYGSDNKSTKKDESTKLSAVDVVSSYLKLFKNHVVEYIITNELNENVTLFNRSALLKKYKFKYIITVPAMWDASARETMAEAAIDATLIKKTELNQLLLISEPGAAALYCGKRFPEEIKQKISNTGGQNFIVCDAGGGTVDLVTYKLEMIDNVLNISQIGDAMGDSCGSNTLDKKFKDYLLQFYEDVGVPIDSSTNINFDGVMRDFNTKHKPYFMPSNGDVRFNIDLPGKKGIVHSHAESKYKLINENTTLIMSYEDMKTKVFDPVVNRIVDLFKAQFQQAIKKNVEINTILMVGGFSQSLYLQQRIKNEFRDSCTIYIPEESTLAMSYGAVMYGLNPQTITKPSAGQSFALMVQGSHNSEDGNSLLYFVTKGDDVNEQARKRYTKEVYVTYPNDAVFAVYSGNSGNSEDKTETDSHTKILETRIALPPNVPGIEDGESIGFKVTLEPSHIEATVVIECQDSRINESVSSSKSGLKVEKKCNLNTLKHKKPLIEYALINSGVHS